MSKYTRIQVAEMKRVMVVTVHNMGNDYVWTDEELQRAIAISHAFIDTLTATPLETLTYQDVTTKIISTEGPAMKTSSPIPMWAGVALIATALAVWCLVIYSVIT